MEIKNGFEVESKEGTIKVTQTITKLMDVKESVVELQKLRSEQLQIAKQKEQLEESIKKNKFEEELEKMVESSDTVAQLEKDWTAAIAPALDSLRKEVKTRIQALKAEKGYDRASKDTQMVIRNKILADVCTDMEINMEHPVFVEVRREFDKI
jgi:hypothetical protein